MLSSILFNCILNIFGCLGIDTNKTDVTLDFSKICNARSDISQTKVINHNCEIISK